MKPTCRRLKTSPTRARRPKNPLNYRPKVEVSKDAPGSETFSPLPPAAAASGTRFGSWYRPQTQVCGAGVQGAPPGAQVVEVGRDEDEFPTHRRVASRQHPHHVARRRALGGFVPGSAGARPIPPQGSLVGP